MSQRCGPAEVDRVADDTVIAAFSLAMAKQGNVRMTSMRAWTAAEMDQILAKVPG